MRKISILLATSILASSFVAQAAQAEEKGGTVETVIVTAQRRQENMQNVPIAITAFNKNELLASGVTDTSDLKTAVPGLNVVQAATFYIPHIRGIGAPGGGVGIENSVATYIDGIYIADMTGALVKLNDVEQVAVLKGPQGTLFGRNATGGVIQITTRSPEQKFTGDIHLTGANLGTYGGDLYMTGGLTDHLAASLSLYGNDQTKGFGRNLFNGRYVYNERDFAGRTKILWTPDADTTVTLGLDYSTIVGASPALTPAPGARAQPFGQVHLGGPWDADLSYQPYSKVRQDGASLTIQHDFGTVARLLSITSYRTSYMDFHLDIDISPVDLVNQNAAQKDRQFSQELQLQSLGNGKLKWVVGAYYFDADSRWAPVNIAGGALAPSTITLLADEATKSWAGFAQATYEILPQTNLTGGVRFTKDRRNLVNSEVLNLGPISIPLGGALGNKDFERTTWRASIDHRFSPELLGYLSFNTGFKGGFYNANAIPLQIVNPEYLTAYEGGIKTNLFNNRVRFNLSSFYYDYKNVQVWYIINGFTQLANGNGAHSYGLDADLDWKVTDNLTLTGGVSWLHARYTSFPHALCTVPLPGGGNGGGCSTPLLPPSPLPTFDFDATGKNMEIAPNYTYDVGLVYVLPDAVFPTSLGELSIAAHDYYNAGWYADPQNRVKQPGYNLVDASVTWVLPKGRWDVRLWGKNLGNTFYASGLSTGDASDTLTAANGRTYGVTIGAHF